jgi:hypothetical protein
MWITILVLSVYINFPAVVGGIFIPSISSLLIAIPLIFLSWKKNLFKIETIPLFYFIAFLLISTLFFGEFSNLSEKTMAFIQICFALITSYTAYCYFANNREHLFIICKWACFLIVAGSILEVLGPLKTFSDYFRNFAFTGDSVSSIYDSEERDLFLTGFERPKVFTAEPSYVSIAFFVFSICYFKLAKSNITFVLIVILSLIMSFLYRSPINYIGIIILFYIFYFESKFLTYGKVGAVVIWIMVFLSIYLLPYVLNSMGREIDTTSILYLNDIELNSQMLRFMVPIHTVKDIWSEFPYFGVGLGGKNTIEQISSLKVVVLYIMGTNNLAYPFMYFGAGGGVIYYALLLNIFRVVDKNYLVTIVPVFFVYSNMLGGLVTLRYWFFLFLFLSAYRLTSDNYRAMASDISK